MKFSKISDSHIHSNNSFDGVNTVDEICKKAIELGRYAITITDHIEANLYYSDKEKYGDFSTLIPQSIKYIKEAQEKYKGKLKIYLGIEVGQPLQDEKVTNEVLSLTKFDFALGSLHSINGYEDFYFLDYKKENIDNLLTLYFEELYQMAQKANISSLAHLTYPLRYIVGNNNIQVDLNKYKTYIDEILKAMIKRDIALEINSSGLRQTIGEPLPSVNIIKLYKKLGGKYVTVGSDAHCIEDLSKGIITVYDLLVESGFSHYTLFEKQEPKLIKLL